MAFIQITDVDAGVTPTAVITNDAGLVWLPGSSAMGAYTNEGAASVSLTETPAGSGRFSATVTLPAGMYSVVFKAGGEVVGHETRTVGAASTDVNVTVTPVINEPLSPLYTNGEASVYQGSTGVLAVDVNDADGPVTLPNGPAFKVYRDTFPVPQVVFSITATTSGNTASIPYTSIHTANAGRFRYELLAADGTILATGLFVILPTA